MKRRNWLWAFPAAIGVMVFKAKDEEKEPQLIHESIKIVHTDGTVYYPVVAKQIEGQERVKAENIITVHPSSDAAMMSIGRKP